MPDVLDNPHRLPRRVRASHYDLHLRPDLESATFAGTVAIDVEVLEATDEIVCNAAELAIHEAWLEREDSSARVELTAHLDADSERAVLKAPSTVQPGAGRLHVSFDGILNDKLRGFYRSTFRDDSGIEHHLATTQFEATDARRAFPCWDEPDLKATFAITLTIDEHLQAVSNGALLSRQDVPGGFAEVRFATTMPMSTYLVAFVVGELEATEPVDVGGTPVRIVHVPGKGDLTAFALEVAEFALTFFEDWYSIDYPGDTLDLVAIPDFAFGAMENLGCVTFREVLLLVDPARATQAELQNVVDVISHELAHMWFGDLVTMRWWEGIWLNEAFATFMEVLATDAFRPAWQRWVSFGLSRSAALDVDALRATRPIEYEVHSPAEAEGMFDLLTYEKGCGVVRMLQQYLGEEPFRAGINRYLRAHSYENTATGDLWDALEAETGEPVRRVADSWILQGGHPLVSAALVDDDGAPGSVRLHQMRARYLGGDDGTRWGVPVLWRAAVDGEVREGRVLLEGDEMVLDVGGDPTWLVLNAHGHGVYRTELAEPLRTATVLAAAAGDLVPIERFALVDDSWAGVLAGRSTAAEHLELLAGLASTERDLSVWQRALSTLHALDRLLDGTARQHFATRVRAMLAPIDEYLGADPRATDDDRARALRGAVLAARAALGQDAAAIERARVLDEAEVSSPGAVEPSLAAAALSVVAAHADAPTADQLWERFAVASTPQDEVRLLGALASIEQPLLLGELLTRSITDAVRTQNAPYALRQAMGVRGCGALVWGFVRDHWEEIGERFPSNSIARMLEGIRSLDEPAVAAEVHAFLDAHPVPQGARIVEQHRERLEVNLALRARETAALSASLLTPASS